MSKPFADHSFPTDRRGALTLAASAFGLIPLASLASAETNPAGTAKGRVRRVIFLFMKGGPSQIDTFDPKPALARFDGTEYSGDQQVSTGNRVAGTLWKSDFQFHQYGESGLQISELFPEVGRHADDLCVIRSMQTSSALHAGALLEMNTGRSQLGSASLGAWVNYGLGTAREHLPQYVVMLDPRGEPINGHGNWATAPLPVTAPAIVTTPERPFLNLQRDQPISPADENRMRSLLSTLNQHSRDRLGDDSDSTQRQQAYELAWAMQKEAPIATDLSQETRATQSRYGLDRPQTSEFGKRCLLARRLLERDVRFVQIYSGGGDQKDTWDSHVAHVERHRQFAGETDRPIAALLEDLKQRGLWEETLVIWGGEFGRTPTREKNSNGRDHNPHGFSMWLAGGGVRGGQAIGATDELGLSAVEDPCHVADLHATILHLLGLDHSTLRFYENGIETGLTGPESCRVIKQALS